MPFIDSYPEPFIPPSSTSRWNITLDILPDDGIDYDIWQARVRVGATEVLVETGMTVNDADLSRTASFTLVDFDDKDLFVSGALIDVGVGKKISGAWDEASMVWEITEGYVESLNVSMAGTPQNATDSVSVTVASKSDERLGKTSEAGLIIYDSDRMTISDDDLKPITDANGNVYTPEAMAIPGLKVSDLFQEIFVNRCGFTSYETNLPESEWPIQRYSVGMGQRFFDGLGAIGCYKPIYKVTDDTIGVYDSYQALPEGIPLGKQITVAHAEQINTTKEQQKLDALMVQFVGLENNYDFTTPRFEYPSENSGESKIDYERIMVEFRKETTPGNSIVIREALTIENKTTSINDEEIEESTEQYLFTPSGDVGARMKTVYAKLPDLPVATAFLKRSRAEDESFGYQVHPFKTRSVYCNRRTQTTAGLVTNDADNPSIHGNPARQAADVAYRSNNMAEGQTYTFESLGSRIETAVPQKDGTVLTRVVQTDAINPINSVDYWEKRPGDIGVSGVATSQEVIPVFADDITLRNAERVEDFPIGELPLKFGLPLARRALIFQQTKGRTMTLTHIGYDKTLQIGTGFSAYDRQGVAVGNFVIEGRQVVCDRGVVIQLNGREVANTAEPLQRIGPTVNAIESGSVQIWTPIPVECEDGFELTIDPDTLANLTVEVAVIDVFGDPGLYWNLETDGPLDLSPFDGTTQNLQFRFTAGVVAVPTRVQFDILTRE